MCVVPRHALCTLCTSAVTQLVCCLQALLSCQLHDQEQCKVDAGNTAGSQGAAGSTGAAASGQQRQGGEPDNEGASAEAEGDAQQGSGPGGQGGNNSTKLEMPTKAEWEKVLEWRRSTGRSKELYNYARQGKTDPEWVKVGTISGTASAATPR